MPLQLNGRGIRFAFPFAEESPTPVRLIAANSRILREVQPSDLHVADETANNRGGNAGSLSITRRRAGRGTAKLAAES